MESIGIIMIGHIPDSLTAMITFFFGMNMIRV
jgi:hypothetical protein